ncbi:MAG TPA: beta-ketoacyl synthase N-terminal-like domain-containing protein [Chthoniobacterales bacterium]|jgi:3-oxoacyl-(acyl-carrier-protein) synthase|nr:beta-ketoacyl synthase N-terminal-like domain-containing protein [Chthoniobacterales bacterium]
MSLRIAGMGWVTPLGRNVDWVWERLLRNDRATVDIISDPVSPKTYHAFRVPNDGLKDLPPHPRLRRASAISRFAAAAGLDALADAESKSGKINMDRLALVFAVSNGGVIYTKRFYHGVVESGAQSASPLLFPETVFNAPASHLAAILGIAGASYTLVGDGAVGLLAIQMAIDLLKSNALDACLVVAAEEADWLLCDAYHKWRLLKKEPPVELFCDPPHGMILSEGAGAILIAREGKVQMDRVDTGGNFWQRDQASAIVQKILGNLADENACIVASANGTFVDLAERSAIEKEMPEAIVYGPKGTLGESVGASALWQTIVGAQALLAQRLPPQSRLPASVGSKDLPWNTAIVLSCGLNQQATGLRLRI